jgi:DNA polymerase-3 subunit gamma/tau
MEQYIVSARKYRPTNFDAVVGQKHVADTLLREIESNKLAQAFLFTGPRGVGKTTCARILAKVINSQGGEVDPKQDFAFNIFELDAASNNSVDDMRNLLDQVRIPPQVGKYKVYIIDEVHMLSASAFNAFLKTLEEPPPYAIFILATTEKHKILPTILSRCQVFNFNRIEVRDMVDHLREIAQKEGVSAEDDALHLIARKADGGLRDALSIFDQLVSYSDGGLTYAKAVEVLNELDADTYFEITDAILNGDAGSCIIKLDSIIRRGFDGSVFVAGLTAHFRNLAVCKDVRTAALLDMSDNFRQKYAEQAAAMGFSLILNGLNLLNDCDEKYKISRHPRLLLELTLMKLANLKSFISHVATLEELKKKALNP